MKKFRKLPSRTPSSYGLVLGAWVFVMSFSMTAAEIGPAQLLEGSQWIEQSDVTHDGVSALQSNPITHDAESAIETSVTGPGKLTFWWKVSSEEDADRLALWVDGELQEQISGDRDWLQRAFLIGEGEHSIKWAYAKDSSIDAGSDAAWLDQVNFNPGYELILQTEKGTASAEPEGPFYDPGQTVRLTAVPDSEVSFLGWWGDEQGRDNPLMVVMDGTKAITAYFGNPNSALETSGLTWSAGGAAKWATQSVITHDGVDALKSGLIAGDQESWVETTITGPGTLIFWWKVSSEEGLDLLSFTLDDTVLNLISGEQDWSSLMYAIDPGSHRIRWSYRKDGSVDDGLDAGWLDQVQLIFNNNDLPSPVVEQTSNGNLAEFRSRVRQVLYFEVTGDTSGSLWGTDIYTDDSQLSTAAVHSGVLDAGETGLVKVVILPGQDTYAATERNEVASLSYGSWSGSYRIESITEPALLTQAFITPSSISFGDMFVGENSSKPLTILNTGSADLNITSTTSNLGDAVDIAETVFTVAPNSSHDLVLKLSPTSPGAIDGILTIVGNTPDSPITVPISGNAIALQGPVIVEQPVSRVVNEGDAVTFVVAATGTAPLTYQWHKDGQDINGATQASYTLENVQLADTGAFTVTVTNSVGSESSSLSTLTVVLPLTQIFVTPSVIGFGDLLVDESASRSCTILNTGSANLNIASVTSNLGDVLRIAETDFSISPGSSHDLSLTLSPAVVGAVAGTLTIIGNTADSPIQIPITGNILPQNIPNTPPEISSIPDQVVNENSSIAGLAFTVSDNESDAGQLVVSAASSDTSLFPSANIVLGGAGQNRTVTISPSENQTGLAVISIHVGDGDLTATASFSVEVREIGPILHPSDNNPADNRISIVELTAYAASWKRGDAWPLDPNPIPIEYVTRAGAIWKAGEVYEHNPELGELPLSWVNETVGLLSDPSSSSRDIQLRSIRPERRAIRSQPSSFQPGRSVEMRIEITPPQSALSYAVEEAVLDGWNVTRINEGGIFDIRAHKVRWGPFFENTPRILKFEIVPSRAESGAFVFDGVISFDGSNHPIADLNESAARFLSATFTDSGVFELIVAGAIGDQVVLEQSNNLEEWHVHSTFQLVSRFLKVSREFVEKEPARFFRMRTLNSASSNFDAKGVQE